MPKRITVSQLIHTAQRALVVGLLGLLLGVLAVPATSLAAQIRPQSRTISHVVHPDPNGDSPIVP